MASCCPAGSWPALLPAEGYVARGSVGAIGDLPIYTVGEPGPRAIVVLPEVFGWGGRLKGICDTLAAEGYFVIMPDCHRGTTASDQPDFGAWCSRYGWQDVVSKDFAAMMRYLAEKGATSVGAIGFCWGVWALCKASSEGVALKCGVGPHPSTRLEGLCFGGDEETLMKALKMPVLLMPAGNDPETLKPGGAIASAVEAAGGASEPFPEMEHGFVSRGDLADAAVKRDVAAAFTKAIAFFKAHL